MGRKVTRGEKGKDVLWVDRRAVAWISWHAKRRRRRAFKGNIFLLLKLFSTSAQKISTNIFYWSRVLDQVIILISFSLNKLNLLKTRFKYLLLAYRFLFYGILGHTNILSCIFLYQPLAFSTWDNFHTENKLIRTFIFHSLLTLHP